MAAIEQDRIADLLEDHPEGMTRKQICDATGKNPNTVGQLLYILSCKGRIRCVNKGRFSVWFPGDGGEPASTVRPASSVFQWAQQ